MTLSRAEAAAYREQQSAAPMTERSQVSDAMARIFERKARAKGVELERPERPEPRSLRREDPEALEPGEESRPRLDLGEEREEEAPEPRDEAPQDSPSAEPEDEPTEAEIRSLADLSKALETDVMDFEVEGGVKLRDRLAQVAELEGKVKTVDQDRQQVYQERLQVAKFLENMATAAREIDDEMQKAERQKLAAEERYEQLRQMERTPENLGQIAYEENRLLGLYGAATDTINQINQRKAALQAQAYQQAVMFHDQELRKRHPEWSDEKAFVEAQVSNMKWAAERFGFSPDELRNAFDWRVREILGMARELDALKSKAKEVSSRPLKPIPTGKQLSAAKVEDRSYRKMLAEARTGSRDDKIKATVEILRRNALKSKQPNRR